MELWFKWIILQVASTKAEVKVNMTKGIYSSDFPMVNLFSAMTLAYCLKVSVFRQ